ncbi:MAG: energy transducer TonB [Rubricoccaceae bacterium]|nr:energy transducer TonB [Rubricoccaceae bacterium]
MQRLTITLVLLMLAPIAGAQDVHDRVDQMPELVGGLSALVDHIEYPESARDAHVEGRVLVQFVVDEEGAIVEPSVLQGVHPDLDAAALAALDEVRFTPGMHEGHPAKVRMILPINFALPPGFDTDETNYEAADVEQMPEIVGGMGSLIENIRYPQEAEQEGIQGRVVVSFVVDQHGQVQHTEVIESAHPLLDVAAVEAIEKTSFTPGLKDGEAVAVQMAVPITFSLPEEGE